MNERPSKKLSLKKETLRRLDTAQLEHLEGAVGGTTPTIIVPTIVTITIDILTREVAEK
ncbi:class I lanthipeptide [Myxococcus sp. 1LA]